MPRGREALISHAFFPVSLGVELLGVCAWEKIGVFADAGCRVLLSSRCKSERRSLLSPRAANHSVLSYVLRVLAE